MNNALNRRLFKISCILILGLFLGVHTMQAQTGTVSVDYKNASPREIIQNLESRTPYKFIFQKNINLDTPRITLKKDNVSIDEVLKELQTLTNLNFIRNDSNIAVNNKPASNKKGKVVGKVVDETGLSLPGATILVQGTSLSTISDANGNYTLSMEPGEYTIQVSFISFQTQNITGVIIVDNGVTPLSVAMSEDATALEEVVVTKTIQRATASVEGMLLEQKRAAQMSDGISAEQISRTPDRDVGATLKRINGVTTVDERFVVVRSMGERWNQAVMDGIPLPSTDAAQQQFNFELIPTAMVESIVVSKNATPDMYANFAGGYVEVRTRDIPKENFTTLTVGTSYNSRSAFKDRLTKQQGKYDYFGFDDGTRSFPSNLQSLPVPSSEPESAAFIEQSRRFTQDNFTTYKTYAAPGTALQFGIGRAYELENNVRWGFVGALVFRNTQEQLDIEHTERGTWMHNNKYNAEGVGDSEYATMNQYGFRNSGASYNYNSTLGGMFNTGIQFGNHKITLRNTLLHMYDNTLTRTTGWNYYNDPLDGILAGTVLPRTTEVAYPVYQLFIQNKIEGEHTFGKLEVNWYAAFGSITKDTRDATFMNMYRDKVGDDTLLYLNIDNSNASNFRRENYTNDQKDYNAALNFTYPFNFSDRFLNTVKAGYFGTYKRASNQQDSSALMAVDFNPDNREVYLTPSQLLDGTHYQWGEFGWGRKTLYGNKFEGDVKVHSPFVMLDNKFGDLVRLVWGLRAESYVYTQISSQAANAGDFGVEQKDDKVWQYLPSVNLTVSPSGTTNLRLGYNKSVLRPQFAERLSMPYVDPVRSAQVLNASNGISSTTVDSYDFKAEWFPTRGQILSVGVYKKEMKDPIESITFLGNDGGSRSIYNMNSHSAKMWGVEMEIYKNLTFLGEGELLEDIYFYGNASINDTKVTGYVNFDGTGGEYEANRPLYGQSPYNYNLGLDYIGERLNFSIRHNATGDQYLLVGFTYDAEEIRKPYAVTDLQGSYRFMKDKNLEFRAGVRNLFDTAIETYNNGNSYTRGTEGAVGRNPRDQFTLGAGATNKFDEGIDRTLFKAWNGRTITIGINYSF